MCVIQVKLADVLGKYILPVSFLPEWPPPCLAIQFATTQFIPSLEQIQAGGYQARDTQFIPSLEQIQAGGYQARDTQFIPSLEQIQAGGYQARVGLERMSELSRVREP